MLTISDEAARQAKWTEILTAVHGSAINLPFSGKGNATIMNKRLTGYTEGQQQFDYPLHTLSATTGANSITVAPASQSGLFSTVGRLDPHTYRPNEFWANNWVYEGLTKCKHISSFWLARQEAEQGAARQTARTASSSRRSRPAGPSLTSRGAPVATNCTRSHSGPGSSSTTTKIGTAARPS